MKKVFVDTSGWGNLVDANQKFHSEANEFYQTVKRDKTRLVTTNYVIAELVSLLSSPLRIPRERSINFINGIKMSALVDFVHIDSALDERSWDLLVSRADKGWSLVDCSSIVLMHELKIDEALTTDRHFEQAGFIRLLK